MKYKEFKKYKIIVDEVEGYCVKGYKENLEKLRLKVQAEGGFIEAVIPVRAVVIYKTPKEILGDK